ncbi:MAG: hypothetical protein R3242_05375 [Akkermansiaceae bacterium]|nr:hypothetical protein [Akkermansiaceae bacterium]
MCPSDATAFPPSSGHSRARGKRPCLAIENLIGIEDLHTTKDGKGEARIDLFA